MCDRCQRSVYSTIKKGSVRIVCRNSRSKVLDGRQRRCQQRYLGVAIFELSLMETGELQRDHRYGYARRKAEGILSLQ